VKSRIIRIQPKEAKKAKVEEKKAEIRARIIERKDEIEKKKDGDDKDDTPKKVQRFEYRIIPKDESKKDDKSEGAKEEHAKVEAPKVGIGVALGEDDGKVVVQNVLPDSPAAKDGRIKAGDQILGIKGDDGEENLFKGKELADVVKLIGGKAGSKIALIVQPKDSDEKKTVELTRGTLDLSKVEGKAEAGPVFGDAIRVEHMEKLKELQKHLGQGFDLHGLDGLGDLKELKGLEFKKLDDGQFQIQVRPQPRSEKKPAEGTKEKKKADLPPPL